MQNYFKHKFNFEIQKSMTHTEFSVNSNLISYVHKWTENHYNSTRVLHASNSSNMVSKDQKCENPIHISSRVRTQDISTYKVVWYKG